MNKQTYAQLRERLRNPRLPKNQFRVELPSSYAKPDSKTVKELSNRLSKNDAVVSLKITTADDCEWHEFRAPMGEALKVYDAALAQLEEISPFGESVRAKEGGELSRQRRESRNE